jgi:hypothetical protein
VISLDLASVAICASTRRCSHPQALTMCSADLPLARSNERRSTLPSMATTPWTVSANFAMNRWNTARNCSGSCRRNRRLKVSWLGKPFSSLRKPRRNGSFAALPVYVVEKSGGLSVGFYPLEAGSASFAVAGKRISTEGGRSWPDRPASVRTLTP